MNGVRRTGFTLLELMVAIAIFAVLGLMSSQMLNNMIRQNDIIDQRGERLIGLQRAMTIMQRDLTQIWSRSVREEYGDNWIPSVDSNQTRPLEFTRTGWRNPLGHRRSELQRVAYEHRETTLYRYYWNVLDRAIDSEPLEQVMLEDVLAVEFELLDGNGDSWPQQGFAPGSSSPLLDLAAISVRFDIEGYGELTRLWEEPAELDRERNPTGGLGEEGTPGPGDADDPDADAGPGNGAPGDAQDGDVSASPVAPDQDR